MIECFGVFSELTGLVRIGSEFAAVQTSLTSLRRISAGAASARAKEVSEASIARFAPPTSRRAISEAWELLLRRPERLLESQPKLFPGFDSSSQAAPYTSCADRLGCWTEEQSRRWNPRQAHNSAVTGPEAPLAAIIGANRLFTGLLLRQIRPRARLTAAPKQRIGSSRNLNSDAVAVPARRARPVPKGSERPGTIAQAASPDPPPATIETLLSKLAWRRLRSLAAKKGG